MIAHRGRQDSRKAGIIGAAAGIAILLFFTPPLGADESWKMLEEGRGHFELKEFDLALSAFKDAVEIRRERYVQASERLETVLDSPEAKQNGDGLRKLFDWLGDRDLRQGDIGAARAAAGGSLAREIEAIESFRISDIFQNLLDVLSDLLLVMPQERLGDSLGGLRDKVLECSRYPEAEYWIGKVFLMEGEQAIAERQFILAVSLASSLSVPGDVHSFRYELATLYLGRRDYYSMEKTLKEVLAGDSLYADPKQARLLEAMRKSVSEQGIDKFLTLYRHDAQFAVKAYKVLGEYYYKTGRYGQAVKHLMLAVDLAATRVVGDLLSRDPDYRFQGLSGLLGSIGADPTLKAYAEGIRFDRSLYYLAYALYGEGKAAQAREIWRSLARGQGEWAVKANASLSKPKLDKAEENPEL